MTSRDPDYNIDAREAKLVSKNTVLEPETYLQFVVTQESGEQGTLLGVVKELKDGVVTKAIIFGDEDIYGNPIKPYNITDVRGYVSQLEYLGLDIVFYKDKAYTVQSYRSDLLKREMKLCLLWAW